MLRSFCPTGTESQGWSSALPDWPEPHYIISLGVGSHRNQEPRSSGGSESKALNTRNTELRLTGGETHAVCEPEQQEGRETRAQEAERSLSPGALAALRLS